MNNDSQPLLQRLEIKYDLRRGYNGAKGKYGHEGREGDRRVSEITGCGKQIKQEQDYNGVARAFQ